MARDHAANRRSEAKTLADVDPAVRRAAAEVFAGRAVGLLPVEHQHRRRASWRSFPASRSRSSSTSDCSGRSDDRHDVLPSRRATCRGWPRPTAGPMRASLSRPRTSSCWENHRPAATAFRRPTAGCSPRRLTTPSFASMILAGGELDGRRYLKPRVGREDDHAADRRPDDRLYPGQRLGPRLVRRPQAARAQSKRSHPARSATAARMARRPGSIRCKERIYMLMVQRANFPNADASEVRRAFQKAAADALAETKSP